MSLRQSLLAKKNMITQIPKKYLVVGAVIFIALFYGIVFRERTLAYSYAGDTCDRQLVIFPDIMQLSRAKGYELAVSGGFKIGDFHPIATEVCVNPLEPPQPGETVASLSPFGGLIAKLSYRIVVPELPRANTEVLGNPIAATRPLKMGMSEVDKTFAYLIKTSNSEADCEFDGAALACDIPELNLKQGAKYDIALERHFQGEPAGTVIEAEVETLSPVTIRESSIKQGETVYSKPKQVVLEADKDIEKVSFTLERLGDKPGRTPVKTQTKDRRVTVSWEEELERESKYRLQAEVFEAKDGSVPLDKYELQFKTSGGPRVRSVSASQSGVALNSQLAVAMDQELKANQDISKLVSVKGVGAAVTHSGKQIFIQLKNTPKCQDFTINIDKNLLSKHDIPAGKDWQRSQRTVCHTVSTVGYSVEGRAINAYEFGNGSRTILFVGAIHGNEVSTYSLMSRWIQELEARAKEIPADKKVVVVPQINPDGVARGSRVNANNVDLNRNFATSDWKRDITTVGNQPFNGGGGKSAMSEPETKAMAAFAARLRPEVTLSYHSIGGLLAANQAGKSNSLASTYTRLSGYRNATGQTSSTFEYSISGTWDDYLAEKLGLASILVELGSHSYHQFERNQAAMWAMVKS